MSQGASREVRADTLQLSLQPNIEARSQGPSGRDGTGRVPGANTLPSPLLEVPGLSCTQRARGQEDAIHQVTPGAGSGQAGSGGQIQNLELSTPGGGAGEELSPLRAPVQAPGLIPVLCVFSVRTLPIQAKPGLNRGGVLSGHMVAGPSP